eukprot:scaffold1954_cov268-Pinguiococcus_pyrenoidosus.AAC.14
MLQGQATQPSQLSNKWRSFAGDRHKRYDFCDVRPAPEEPCEGLTMWKLGQLVQGAWSLCSSSTFRRREKGTRCPRSWPLRARRVRVQAAWRQCEASPRAEAASCPALAQKS